MKDQGRVAFLEHDEIVVLDPACLVALYRDLGALGAESVITRTIAEISERMDTLSRPHRSGDWGDLARRARGLAAIAEQAGMTTLARVARGVAQSAINGDAAALGATLARLDRVAYRSLSDIWDMTGTGM